MSVSSRIKRIKHRCLCSVCDARSPAQDPVNVFALEVKVKVHGRKLSWEAAINILHSSALLSSRGRMTNSRASAVQPHGPEPSQLWASAHPGPEGPGGRSDVLPASVRPEAARSRGGPCLNCCRKQALPPPKHGRSRSGNGRAQSLQRGSQPPIWAGVTGRSASTRITYDACARPCASRANFVVSAHYFNSYDLTDRFVVLSYFS